MPNGEIRALALQTGIKFIIMAKCRQARAETESSGSARVATAKHTATAKHDATAAAGPSMNGCQYW